MKSMTGFGKAQAMTEQYQVDIEIKSVNQRFLDCQFRMPRFLNEAESQMRQLLKQQLTRGRVEVFVTITDRLPSTKTVTIDWTAIEQVVQQTQTEMQQRFEQTIDLSRLIEQLLAQETFFTIQEATTQIDEERLPIIMATFERALEAITTSRVQEGDLLQVVLEEQTQVLMAELAQLQQFTTVYEKEYQERFRKKVEEQLADKVDEPRLLTEIALLIERGDIREELDRLTVHLTKLTDLLHQKEPVGRELDFLIQELNREVNTIGSKSTALTIKNHVVQLKTIIEKLREQVQNIE